MPGIKRAILTSTYRESKPYCLEYLIFASYCKELPQSFTDNKGVTKSSYPAQNAPKRMEVPN